MVLKIEYILLVVFLILSLSMIGISPTSIPSSRVVNDDKEILFEEFSLVEVKERSLGQKLFAKEGIKYKTDLVFKEINLTDEQGNNIQASKGSYRDDTIAMENNISFRRYDGLTFVSEKLNYDIKSKLLESDRGFALDLNGSHIGGRNLIVHLNEKNISADRIEARIFFSD